jgi:hypothetical protein
VCPDFEVNGNCSKRNCAHLHSSNKKETKRAAAKAASTEADGSAQRYYSEKDESISERRERVLANVRKMKAKFAGGEVAENVEIPIVSLQNRPKLGTTPAFIPI